MPSCWMLIQAKLEHAVAQVSLLKQPHTISWSQSWKMGSTRTTTPTKEKFRKHLPWQSPWLPSLPSLLNAVSGAALPSASSCDADTNNDEPDNPTTVLASLALASLRTMFNELHGNTHQVMIQIDQPSGHISRRADALCASALG